MYADEFSGIPQAIANNPAVRTKMHQLIDEGKIPGKVLEDRAGQRIRDFKTVLRLLTNGQLNLQEAYHRTEDDLPRHQSMFAGDNRVFAHGWAERLVRTQFSRFYNQAVMELELAKGAKECFVPPSQGEDPGSKCSIHLAGNVHDLTMLHDRLISSYEEGKWDQLPKIPDHPHCTHVVKPMK